MVIIMRTDARPEEVDRIVELVEQAGFTAFINPGVERKVIALLGAVDAEKSQLADRFSIMPGVERVTPISEPYKLAAREAHPADSVVMVGGVPIGGKAITVIAGPCSIESREQMLETAREVKAAGATLLRGGAFKPRTSPYAFQGLGREALEFLAEARAETGLPVVTEIMDPHDISMVAKYADMLQIGARNMQNFRLLQRVARTGKPVLLKRGPGCKVRDLLMAAEYVMAEGDLEVVLCERGITTFEDSTRYTTDINAVPVLKRLTHLPVIVDPSHATGDWRYVEPICRAAIAAGADGVMVEVHRCPSEARCDGPQALEPARFKTLMAGLVKVAAAVGRKAQKA